MSKTREDYIKGELESGIKVGDIVKITREAKTGEDGWDNTWEEYMTPNVGGTFEVLEPLSLRGDDELAARGIVLRAPGMAAYPYFVLEKVEKKEDKPKAKPKRKTTK